MKTERIAIAYRLLFAYPFVRPESEQNSSHLQIDCDRRRWQSSFVTIEVSAQADILTKHVRVRKLLHQRSVRNFNWA
jgi:hypothetical protein